MTVATVCRLHAGDLAAEFQPERGMLGTSLTHRGEELLRLTDDLDEAAARGRSVGIPLLYPWANRLRGTHYDVLGQHVELDKRSPWLLTDWNDVILHGVPWSKLHWEVTQADDRSLTALLPWDRPELLAVFPFPHTVEMEVALDASGLTLRTRVLANSNSPVPVSFGFHPYIAIPGLPREQWRLTLPPMERLVLDHLLIPTGRREPFAAYDDALGDLEFDTGFAFTTPQPVMSIAGAGRRIAVLFGAGYRYAQIYAPIRRDYISFEPMTAPTNALVTGEALPIVAPGQRYEAMFRIEVSSIA